ncbi:MAG: transposase zinc-binding domain-containing protein [Planctomycetaceae bacterium]|nr:transposase zinc-binding domain-containing protein [Planctomycetaceae bacterium]
MPTLGEVYATYGAAYLDHYGDRVPTEHRRMLQLLADCGTGRLGAASFCCAQCAAIHHTNASCGNRHCPRHSSVCWSCRSSLLSEWQLE